MLRLYKFLKYCVFILITYKIKTLMLFSSFLRFVKKKIEFPPCDLRSYLSKVFEFSLKIEQEHVP